MDYVKAIAMILVILGHINFANQGIKAWIYAFHMPVFFFVTGYVLNIEGSGFRVFVDKYFKRLLIPYFIWALIFAKLTIPNLLLVLYGSYASIVKAGSLSSLWFLPVMFIAVVLFFLTKTVLRHLSFDKPWVNLVLCAAAFVSGVSIPRIGQGYPWSINVSLVAYSFLVLGALLRPYMEGIYRRLEKKNVWMVAGASLLFFAGTMLYKLNIPEQGNVLMGNARYGNPAFFAVTSVCGVLLLFTLSVLLDFVSRKELGFLSFVGQNTLCIFAVQKPIIRCFNSLFHHVHVPDGVALVSTTLGTLLISCAICLIVNRFAPVIVGKQAMLPGSQR